MAGVGTWILAGIMAESVRKSHVAGRIAREENLRQAEKAEKRSRDIEAKNLMIRQLERNRKKDIQTSGFFPNTDSGGNIRSDLTIGGNTGGGGGGNSGVNY